MTVKKRRTKAQMITARRRSASARKARLKSIHHMTMEQYEKLLELQGGVCYLCQRPGVRKFLAVDHDHKVAREVCSHPPNESCQRCWRGLLHGPCNAVLATARDSIGFFQRAVDYLKNPPARRL